MNKIFWAKILSSISSRFGRLGGFILRPLSLNTKKSACLILEKTLRCVPQPVFFVAYSFVYELIKGMSRLGESVSLERNFPFGRRLALDVFKKTSRQIFLYQVYEPEVYNFIIANLNRGDVFFDIGANIGYFSLLASSLVGDNGQVFSFEPEKDNFDKLKQNVKINKLKNVSVINAAAGQFTAGGQLNINPLNDGGHSLNSFSFFSDSGERWSLSQIKSKFVDTELTQQVSVLAVDDYIERNGIDRVNLIKIDTEGFELNVMRGMKKTLAKNRDLSIICEISKDEPELRGILLDNGFSAYSLGRDGTITEQDLRLVFKKGNMIFKK